MSKCPPCRLELLSCAYQVCLIARLGISYLILSHITYKSKFKTGIFSGRPPNRNKILSEASYTNFIINRDWSLATAYQRVQSYSWPGVVVKRVNTYLSMYARMFGVFYVNRSFTGLPHIYQLRKLHFAVATNVLLPYTESCTINAAAG